jgi:hypothetical protein
MATIFKRPRSKYWQAAYFDGEGRRVFRSTRKSGRPEATVAAAELERHARRTTGADVERIRRLMAILEEAGGVAIRGALTEGSARDFLNRIHEAATGERMNTPYDSGLV